MSETIVLDGEGGLTEAFLAEAILKWGINFLDDAKIADLTNSIHESMKEQGLRLVKTNENDEGREVSLALAVQSLKEGGIHKVQDIIYRADVFDKWLRTGEMEV